MPDFELFQERTISGKGLLRVPSELAKRRAVVLYCDLIRPPSSPYYNANYTPPQGFLGTVTFVRNEYVIAEDKIRYPRQSWDAVPDITAQNLIAIKCMYKGVLQSFVNFATAAGYAYISVEDKIKDYEYLDLMWDEVRITCYADTALKLRLFALANDKCQDDADKPKKPQKPPLLPPPVPPKTPIVVDPPYEDEGLPTDDVTEPYPGDETPPNTEGEICQLYNVTFRFMNAVPNIFGGHNLQAHTETFQLYGDFGDYGLGGEGYNASMQFTGFSNAWINCRGGPSSVNPDAPTCLPEMTQCFFYGGPSPFISSIELLGYEPA